MDWNRIFNPWASLREAETTIAILQDRLEEAYARADDAEGKAFLRAADHYWQRNRMIEAQLKHTQRQVATIVSMTLPRPPIFQSDDLPASPAPAPSQGQPDRPAMLLDW